MARTCHAPPTNFGWNPKKAASYPWRVEHQGGEGGRQPYMATYRLFLCGIQAASPLPRRMKEERVPIGRPPFKASPPCSVQSSWKGLMLKWSLSPAPEQNTPESILMQFSACGEFQILLFFSLILNMSFFQCQNTSMSRKTTPYSATLTTWASKDLQKICSFFCQNHD